MRSPYDDPAFYDVLFDSRAHAGFCRSLRRDVTGHVLELACGTGRIIASLGTLPNRLFGFDLSEVMIARARREPGAQGRVRPPRRSRQPRAPVPLPPGAPVPAPGPRL